MNFVWLYPAVALVMESLDEASFFAIEGGIVFAMCCLWPWRVERRECVGYTAGLRGFKRQAMMRRCKSQRSGRVMAWHEIQ